MPANASVVWYAAFVLPEARPKSASLAWPVFEIRMFSGLMSRCRMPASWAVATRVGYAGQ